MADDTARIVWACARKQCKVTRVLLLDAEGSWKYARPGCRRERTIRTFPSGLTGNMWSWPVAFSVANNIQE